MKRFLLLLVTIVFYLLTQGQSILQKKLSLSSPQATLQQQTPAATVDAETSTGGRDRKPDCPKTGANSFDAYNGNVHREIKDLELWAGAGQPLVWMRYSNSRNGTFISNFGNAHNWNNSYQYSMVDAFNRQVFKPGITIHYPEGGEDNFVQDATLTNQWVAQGAVNKRLFQYGNNFFLQTVNGFRYHFEKQQNGFKTAYILRDFKDSYQNQYTLTYNPDQLFPLFPSLQDDTFK